MRNLWKWALALALVWVFDFAISDSIDPYFFSILMYAGINITLAVSLNLVNGFTGQFSMGHTSFMWVGGYTAAFLTTLVRDSSPALVGSPLGLLLYLLVLC